MKLLIVFICTVAACFLLRNPIKKAPIVFYAMAIAIDCLFIAGSMMGVLPREVWSVLFFPIQKCTVPLAMFVVVMYVGVLPRTSKAYAWLKPIRAELSIIAWFLSLGHVTIYLASYLTRLLSVATMNFSIAASVALAIVLLILLIVLGVTSFAFVKKHMRAETWKKIQKLAYPFFALVYVHLLLILFPAAARGGESAQVSVAIYTVVFWAYIILKIKRSVGGAR